MATAAVVRDVKQALDENDIKIPFPQRELTGREETGGFEVAPGDAELTRSPADRVEQSNGQ